MSHELLYTSAAEGLKPGSHGFCTVEWTERFPPGLSDQLESLSRHCCRALLESNSHHLTQWSHLILESGGQRYHVLSRVAPLRGKPGRPNAIAHHVALRPEELPRGNPAWVLGTPGFAQTQWDGPPRVLAAGRQPPAGVRSPSICEAWKAATGDSGWAGVLAANALQPGGQVQNMIVPADLDLLPLVEEALAIVPPERQWHVTFSTCFTGLPSGIECRWRFVPDHTPEARSLRQSGRPDVLDLCASLGPPPESDLVAAARTGSADLIPLAPPAHDAEDLVPLEPADESTVPLASYDEVEPRRSASRPAHSRRRSRMLDDDDDDAAPGGYPIGRAAQLQRLSRPAAAFNDPRMTRSPDDLVVGRPDRIKRRNGVLLASLVLIGGVGIALAIFLRDGSTATSPARESNPFAERIGRRAPAETRVDNSAPEQTAADGSSGGESQQGSGTASPLQPAGVPLGPASAATTAAPHTSPGNPSTADDPADPAASASDAAVTGDANSSTTAVARSGIAYMAGWETADLVFSGREPEDGTEPLGPRLRPGDVLAVLPRCRVNVHFRDDADDLQVALVDGAAARFAGFAVDGSNRQHVLELLTGKVVLTNHGSQPVRVEIGYRGPGNRPAQARTLIIPPDDHADAELRPAPKPEAPPQFIVHGRQSPSARAGSPLGAPLGPAAPLGPRPTGAGPNRPPQPETDDLPVVDVLSSAGLEPGVQPLTLELHEELIDRLEQEIEEIDRRDRLDERRPPRRTQRRPGRPDPTDIREDRQKAAEQCLQLLRAVTPTPAEPAAE